MMRPAVKICGITTPHMAELAAQAGADYVGLVLHPESPRYVELSQVASIAQAARNNGARPVAVVVDQDANAIQRICRTAQINIVQLHSLYSQQQALFLAESIKRIVVYTPESVPHDLAAIIDDQRDYVLYDNACPGSGHFVWNDVYSTTLPYARRSFLAGGLTAANVICAIKRFQPMAVDVSSGVESQRGVKDIKLIQQFIQRIEAC